MQISHTGESKRKGSVKTYPVLNKEKKKFSIEPNNSHDQFSDVTKKQVYSSRSRPRVGIVPA